jgi:hypothetical protein
LYTGEKFFYQVTEKRVWFNFSFGELSFTKLPYDDREAYSLMSNENLGNADIKMSWFKRALNVLNYFKVPYIVFKSVNDDFVLQYRKDDSFKLGTGQLGVLFNVSAQLLRGIIMALPDWPTGTQVRVSSNAMEFSYGDRYKIEVSRVVSEVQKE